MPQILFWIFHKKMWKSQNSFLFPSHSEMCSVTLCNAWYIFNGAYRSFKAIFGWAMIFPNSQYEFPLCVIVFFDYTCTEETNLTCLNFVVYFLFIQIISVIPVDWRLMPLNSISTVNVLHFQLFLFLSFWVTIFLHSINQISGKYYWKHHEKVFTGMSALMNI